MIPSIRTNKKQEEERPQPQQHLITTTAAAAKPEIINPLVQNLATLIEGEQGTSCNKIQVAEAWNALGLARLHMERNPHAALECHWKALEIIHRKLLQGEEEAVSQQQSTSNNNMDMKMATATTTLLCDIGLCHERLRQPRQKPCHIIKRRKISCRPSMADKDNEDKKCPFLLVSKSSSPTQHHHPIVTTVARALARLQWKTTIYSRWRPSWWSCWKQGWLLSLGTTPTTAYDAPYHAHTLEQSLRVLLNEKENDSSLLFVVARVSIISFSVPTSVGICELCKP